MARERKSVFWICALAWLPAGIIVVSILRGAAGLMPLEPLPMMLMAAPMAFLSLIPVVPCGLPLALAWRQTRRLGHARAAWAAAAVLAPLTAFASLFAGLLGPLAIGIYAAVLSAPAWILYGILRRRERLGAEDSH